MSGLFFDVTAELKSHRRQDFCREIIFAARSETLKERGAQDRGWRGGFDRGKDRPAAFAGVGDAAGKALEGGLFEQGNRGEIEQPGGHNAAAATDFRDIREIEVVMIMLGIAEG